MAEQPHSSPGDSTADGGMGGFRMDRRGELRGLNRGTMMMGLMFLAGLGWVFWESRKVEMYTPSDEDARQEGLVNVGLEEMKQSARRTGKNDNVAERIETFYYDARQRQAPLERVKVNPYVLEKPAPVATVSPTVKPSVKVVVKNPTKAAPPPQAPSTDQLVLHMVHVVAGMPQAVVSGRSAPRTATVRQGDTIDGWTVHRIESDQVVLHWKGESFILKSTSGKRE